MKSTEQTLIPQFLRSKLSAAWR
uniref:Uncharacterized protein n=1 Tax=Anguilla anguilla TaxID=7936 RepID=A0A0E9PBG3_ANGAN